jgi:hypothetical protein
MIIIAIIVNYGLRIYENRVLRRMFGPKRDEVTSGWRKLHNEELHDFYFSPSIIRMINSMHFEQTPRKTPSLL